MLVGISLLWAGGASAQEFDAAGWQEFLDGVRAEALEKGISEPIVTAALTGLEPMVKAVKATGATPEEIGKTLAQAMEKGGASNEDIARANMFFLNVRVD